MKGGVSLLVARGVINDFLGWESMCLNGNLEQNYFPSAWEVAVSIIKSLGISSLSENNSLRIHIFYL